MSPLTVCSTIFVGFILSTKQINGVFILDYFTGIADVFNNITCNDNFTVMPSRGILNVRLPSDANLNTPPFDCYCIMHPSNDNVWPNNVDVPVDWFQTDGDRIAPWLTISATDISSLHNSVHFYLSSSPANSTVRFFLWYNNSYYFRDLDSRGFFRFNPTTIISVNLSCSSQDLYRPDDTSYSSTTTTTSTSTTITSTSTTTATISSTNPSPENDLPTTANNVESSTQPDTTTILASKGRDKNDITLYIITGAAAGGVTLLIIIIIIIVLLMKKKYACVCCQSNKDKSKEYAVKYNSNGADETDKPTNAAANHEYVNVHIEPPPGDTIEYAQVDTSRLAPRQQSQKEKESQNKDEVALTYADLDFVKKNDADLVPNEIYEGQEHAEAENDTQNPDISEMYAQPMKKGNSRKEANEQKLDDKQDMDMSEMYAKPMKKPKPPKENLQVDVSETHAKPMKKPKPPKETVDKDISEMYATSTKKPKSTS